MGAGNGLSALGPEAAATSIRLELGSSLKEQHKGEAVPGRQKGTSFFLFGTKYPYAVFCEFGFSSIRTCLIPNQAAGNVHWVITLCWVGWDRHGLGPKHSKQLPISNWTNTFWINSSIQTQSMMLVPICFHKFRFGFPTCPQNVPRENQWTVG